MAKSYTTTQLPIEGDVIDWLRTQCTANRKFLLAYAFDGVIWGQHVDSSLQTALDAEKADQIDDPVSPELREATLMEAFVFGDTDQVHLFRDELDNWKAILCADGDLASDTHIDENMMLAADTVVAQVGNFTQTWNDRKQVAAQLIPIEINETALDDKTFHAYIRRRNYVVYDEATGVGTIGMHRLVNVFYEQNLAEVDKSKSK